MKKTLLSLLLLTLTLVSVCHAEPVADSALPSFDWERNAVEHWRVLPSGEKTDLGSHHLEDAVCTVCGSEVWAFDGGTADVSDYNEHGDLVRYTSFDEDGSLTFELRYAYEYDAEGHILVSREFTGDVLTTEIVYNVGSDGEQIPVSQVVYYDDDTWAANEYDEHGNLIHSVSYDPDGTISVEEFSEFAQNAEGRYYEWKQTSRYSNGAVFYSEFNEYGDPIRHRSTEADGAVWEDVTYEYEYAEGVARWKKQYSNGILTLEAHYHPDGYTEREIEYFDGGARMVTDYNDYADPVTITSYAADGSIETVQTYEYEYDEDMSFLTIRAYTDGKLVILTEYANEDGWHYVRRETIYDEDGSYTVFDFNAAEELVSQTDYDVNGQVIH